MALHAMPSDQTQTDLSGSVASEKVCQQPMMDRNGSAFMVLETSRRFSRSHLRTHSRC